MIVWPIVVLALVAAAFVATIATDRVRAGRRAAAIYAMARETKMNYSPLDRFDLAARLRQRGDWLIDTTDLLVRDVLYTARGDERHFVLTASRRHTIDQRPTLFVVACRECVHSGTFMAFPPQETAERDVVESYRQLIARHA